MDRVTVAEAAQRLGISKDAVRQRIRRNTIEYKRDERGSVYVLLPPEDAEQDAGAHADHDAVLLDYVETLKERIRNLEEESRRKDHILALQLEHMRALEPPSEARRGPLSDEEGTSRGGPRPGARSQP